jgi:hypothetical protein
VDTVLLLAVEPLMTLALVAYLNVENLQSGSVVSTVMFHVTPGLPSGLGMKPESIPPSIFLQGSAKVD